MKRIQIGDATIEVDLKKTAELYRQAKEDDWCQCEGCTNIRIAMPHFFPRELAMLLASCGAMPHYP